MDFTLNPEIQVAFRFISLELKLTEHGLKEYEKVLAIVFEYFKVVKDDWLKEGTLDFFKESKLISDLSYKIYSVPL